MNKLILISSQTCNLKCKYCEIAKTVSKEVREIENYNIQQSFLNGMYLKNIEKIFNQKNISLKDIEILQLWGEEPLINFSYFSVFFTNFIVKTPNLRLLKFTTNFTTNINNLIYFIKQNINNFKTEFKIMIQISYDGIYGNLNNRNISEKLIENNIFYFINKISPILLQNKKLKIHIGFHNVINKDVILNNNAENLVNELNNFYLKINDFNTNEQIIIQNFTTVYEHPYNATKEYGQLFSKYLKDYLTYIKINNFSITMPVFNHQLNLINFKNKYKDFDFNIQYLIYELLNNSESKQNIFPPDKNFSCSPGLHSLIIKYNGNITYCHDAIYNINKKYNMNIEDTQLKIIRDTCLNYNFTINGLDVEQFNNWQKQWSYIKANQCCSQLYNLIVCFMTLLSQYNQIDKSYYNNPNKILKHSFLLLFYFLCWEDNLITSNSIFGINLGMIRLFCNGFLDYVEDLIKEKYYEIQYR